MTGHAHEDGGRCPLCPDDAALAAMRDRNRANDDAKRLALLEAIAADPTAFVHVVQGSDGVSDPAPIVMVVSTTLDAAKAYCEGVRGSGFYEILPHRLDDPKSGHVVTHHSVVVDGVRTLREGRAYAA